MTGCLFVGNVANMRGGGMFNCNSSPTITYCTFSGHASTARMYNRGGMPNVANCIMWGNARTVFVGPVEVRYSCIEGGWAGEGNTNTDPMFAPVGPSGVWTAAGAFDPQTFQVTLTDATADWTDDRFVGKFVVVEASGWALQSEILANTASTITIWAHSVEQFWGSRRDSYEIRDYHLMAGSPVIDAADNTAVPEGTGFDLDGNPRFVDDPETEDTGRGEPPIVDMGPYEFQVGAGGCTRDPEWLCDGDVDGDGQVNPVDSGLVQAAFGSADESDLCQYDVDCDGQINPVDAGIVQSLFGTCDAPRGACP